MILVETSTAGKKFQYFNNNFKTFSFFYYYYFAIISTSGLLINLSSAFCPPRCRCTQERAPTVDCTDAGLRSIPILLNPRTRSLILRGNSIATVSHEELEFYQDLERLDLGQNEVYQLDRGAFFRLSKLAMLHLNDNRLDSVKIETFLGLSRLELLDLSGNRLERVATSVFVDLHRLKVLNLTGNQVYDISPGGFTGLDRVTDVLLAENRLTDFPAAPLLDLPHVVSLDLSGNQIEAIPPRAVSRRNRHLSTLNLANNQVSVVSEAAFEHAARALSTLDLSGNRLTDFPTLSFRQLADLTRLDIGGNPFEDVPTSAFEGLAGLTKLSIKNCPNLEFVDLNAFSGLNALETLTLSHNPRLELLHPMAFEKPNYIQKVMLHLKRHRITLQRKSRRQAFKQTEVDFSHNALSDLPETLLNWQELRDIRLVGNPWDCTCQFRWISIVLREKVRDSQGSSYDESAVCQIPYSMASVPLTDYSEVLNSACLGESVDLETILSVGLVATVLSATVLAAVCFFAARRRRHRLHGSCQFEHADFCTTVTTSTGNTVAARSSAQFVYGGTSRIGSSNYGDFMINNNYLEDDDSKKSLLILYGGCGGGPNLPIQTSDKCDNSPRCILAQNNSGNNYNYYCNHSTDGGFYSSISTTNSTSPISSTNYSPKTPIKSPNYSSSSSKTHQIKSPNSQSGHFTIIRKYPIPITEL